MPKGINLEKLLLYQSDYASISSFINALHEINTEVFRKLYDKFVPHEGISSPRNLPDILNYIEKGEYLRNKEGFVSEMYQIIDKELKLKSKRYGRLWAGQYTEENIPKGIIEIFQSINNSLEGKEKKRYAQLDL